MIRTNSSVSRNSRLVLESIKNFKIHQVLLQNSQLMGYNRKQPTRTHKSAMNKFGHKSKGTATASFLVFFLTQETLKAHGFNTKCGNPKHATQQQGTRWRGAAYNQTKKKPKRTELWFKQPKEDQWRTSEHKTEFFDSRTRQNSFGKTWIDWRKPLTEILTQNNKKTDSNKAWTD